RGVSAGHRRSTGRYVRTALRGRRDTYAGGRAHGTRRRRGLRGGRNSLRGAGPQTGVGARSRGAGVIDIHSHLLSGVDDGSPSIDVSVPVLQRFGKSGVELLVCTPHLRATDAARA